MAATSAAVVDARAHGDRLERHRHAGLAHARKAAHEPIVLRSRVDDFVVGLARSAVLRDLERQRRTAAKQREVALGHQRRVGVDGEDHPLLVRVLVDFAEVGAQERLAAGQRQVEHAGVGTLIDDPAPLVGGELARAGVAVGRRQVDVAVDARQVAAEGQLEAGGDGESIVVAVLMQRPRQRTMRGRHCDGDGVAHAARSPRVVSSPTKASMSRPRSTSAGTA
jgi:hypothetical protein